jgi:hypothetical protein
MPLGAAHLIRRLMEPLAERRARADEVLLGLYPIVTFQYSSTTLCQFYYHIQYLFF